MKRILLAVIVGTIEWGIVELPVGVISVGRVSFIGFRPYPHLWPLTGWSRS